MKVEKGISVIIPCWNTGSYILETIASITSQPIKCLYEIVVVNDGSTNLETLDSLKSLSSNPLVKVIDLDENKGTQYARNVGFNASNYEYVVTIDSDDKLNTDAQVLSKGTYFDNSIEILSNNDNVAFTHGLSLMFGDFNGLTISSYAAKEKLIIRKHHAQQSVVYRRSDGIAAGLYDESVKKWTDWTFAVALLNGRFKRKLPNDIHFFDVPYFLYRVHNTTVRMSERVIQEREMTKLTIEHNPEIFMNEFPHMSLDEITDKVVSLKPDRLTDLMYVAAESLPRALRMLKERKYSLVSDIVPISVP